MFRSTAVSLSIPLLFLSFQAQADKIEITMPAYPDGSHAHFHDVMVKSLEAAGHTVIYKKEGPYPQKRALELFDQEKVNAVWLVETDERNAKYIKIPVGLTNGLISTRILFIPKGSQAKYSAVKSLEDFKKLGLVGGFGKGWFDVKVWEANGLKVAEEDGEWRKLYNKVAAGNRNVDYFSRGAHEILPEAKENPTLDIEQNLSLNYDRDVVFYIPKSSKYKDVIESALKKAKESGLLEKLIRENFKEVFEKLSLDKRVKIKLTTPK